MMKNSIVFMMLSFFIFQMSAQTLDTIYLWPTSVPGETAPYQNIEEKDTEGDIIKIKSVTNPLMVKFEAPKNKDMAIIVAPGGGYYILAVDKEGYEVAEALNKMNITAYVLQYRVPKKEEQALIDMQRAIRKVRAEGYKKIGIMGFSAGGSLSARAATRFSENIHPAIDKTDDLSARPDFAVLIYPAYLDRGENQTLTPELTITEETPPFFIFGTADDKHGNSSLVMAKALRDKGVAVDLHLMSVGGHGYGLRKGNPAAEAWPGLLEKWLETFR